MSYTLTSDLRVVPDYSAEELNRFLANSPLNKAGGDFVNAGRKYGVNPIYIMSLGILESSWGRSHYAQTRNNLFGYQAYDRNPDLAASFSSFSNCINFITNFLSMSYLRPKNGQVYTLLNGQRGNIGQWYGGAPTLEGVYKVGSLASNSGKYATAPHAAQAVCDLMNQFVRFIARPVGATPPANGTSTTPVSVAGSYTVQRGDTLWGIAERFLGAGSRYHEIVAINSIGDPKSIYAGQVLRVPSQKQDIVVAAVETTKNRNHVVARGENLWAISEKYYGNGGQYHKIVAANSNLIKQNNLIQVGWNLTIPE